MSSGFTYSTHANIATAPNGYVDISICFENARLETVEVKWVYVMDESLVAKPAAVMAGELLASDTSALIV